jgi:hypothetical protein
MPRLIVRKDVAIAVIVGLWLTGCSSTSEPAPEPVASVEPQFTYFASGTATQNLPIFENVLADTGAGRPGHDLSESVALLVDTGFDLEAITHTPLDSKTGEPAESVSLAINFGGECLIAQFSSTWLITKVADETASGCLIGDVEQASQLSN